MATLPLPGPDPAVPAEPRGTGTSGARDPLSREVNLLGALLGQVIVEQEGEALLAQSERLQRATIEVRRCGSEAARQALGDELDKVDLLAAEGLIRAFSLHFQLANLAEEKQRVRRLRRLGRASPGGLVEGSIATAIWTLRAHGASTARLAELAGTLTIGLVLTAHPTEARRRTVLRALRRCYCLLDRFDDPRLTRSEDAESRRRLREEISLLWHTSALRAEAPSPIDEVRSVMAFFDESLFAIVPRLCRELDLALDETAGPKGKAGARHTVRATGDSGPSGTRPPHAGAFLHWGSWVGGDRDGNPNVTAQTTRLAVRVQADHVLHAYEGVAHRLMHTVAAVVPSDATPPALAARLALDARELPDTMADLDRRFPLEPYRRRFGAIAERLRRTRLRLVDGMDTEVAGAYAGPGTMSEELVELREALVSDRLGRTAWGEVQDLCWQLETFGFHGLDLEVRQHSEVHAAALAILDAAGRTSPTAATLAREVSARVTVGEVLETFRAMGDIQAAFGEAACHRYVISLTHAARDVLHVLELARRAGDPVAVLDVVPLFESADALKGCRAIMDDLLADGRYRRHLASRGDRQEVMLGYSDSTKESGTLAASWMLHQAHGTLAETGARHGVELTVFEGRGGAIGRGGGPMSRAILSQAPGSVRGRFKVTEQGEVIAARYANPAIALRHLERLTNAVLMASSPAHEQRVRESSGCGAPVVDELAETSRRAYRAVVWDDPGFEDFFRAATPIEELASLAIGSRPAARASGEQRRRVTMDTLRAIPWVFAWSQARLNLPGWFGVGSALTAYERKHGAAGMERLRALYRDWSFFSTMLDTVELSLAKADIAVAGHYAGLATGPRARVLWRRLREEYETTRDAVLSITGRERLLDAIPDLQRSIELRDPYMDSLSELQVRLLSSLRGLAADDPRRAEFTRLVHLTVNGVAAGLQNTG